MAVVNGSRYTQNGLLQMMERNQKIKRAPERFQESEELFDVIITCEERCFDIVTEEINNRGMSEGRLVHIVNFEIKDSPEEATIGARQIQQFVSKAETWLMQIEALEDLEGIESVIEEFAKSDVCILHTVAFY